MLFTLLFFFLLGADGMPIPTMIYTPSSPRMGVATRGDRSNCNATGCIIPGTPVFGPPLP